MIREVLNCPVPTATLKAPCSPTHREDHSLFRLYTVRPARSSAPLLPARISHISTTENDPSSVAVVFLTWQLESAPLLNQPLSWQSSGCSSSGNCTAYAKTRAYHSPSSFVSSPHSVPPQPTTASYSSRLNIHPHNLYQLCDSEIICHNKLPRIRKHVQTRRFRL